MRGRDRESASDSGGAWEGGGTKGARETHESRSKTGEICLHCEFALVSAQFNGRVWRDANGTAPFCAAIDDDEFVLGRRGEEGIELR